MLQSFSNADFTRLFAFSNSALMSCKFKENKIIAWGAVHPATMTCCDNRLFLKLKVLLRYGLNHDIHNDNLS